MSTSAAVLEGAKKLQRRVTGGMIDFDEWLDSTPTFLPLTVGRVLYADGELAAVGVEAGGVVHAGRARRRQRQLVGVARHAVQRLGQVGRPLQDDLLQRQRRKNRSG